MSQDIVSKEDEDDELEKELTLIADWLELLDTIELERALEDVLPLLSPPQPINSKKVMKNMA